MEKRVLRLLMTGLVAALLMGPAAVGQPIEAESRVKAVTLYRDQALVTRLVRAEVPGGLSELVVGDLPPQLVPDSLFAGAEGRTQVRAVRFRTRAVKEEPREEIRRLEQQIEALKKALRRNEAMRALVQERRAYLSKLEQFTAPTAQVELTKGVLNAETLETLTLFIFGQRADLTEKMLKLEDEKGELSKQISLLQREKAQLTAGTTRTLREAVLFVDRPKAGPVELRLSYLVNRAGWEPAYNLRAGEDAARVTVEYNATVHQMSGEDWHDVDLTLSTASPTLMAKGPDLAPFWVALGSARPAERQLEQKAQAFRKKLAVSQRAQQKATQVDQEMQATVAMNYIALDMQVLELAASGSELRRLRRLEAAPTEGWAVTYALPGRTSLDSRSDRQMVRIASLKLKSEFYYVATPLLTDYVYREAEVVNQSDLALLEGPATCYLDGRFVGRSRVPMVARGQRFRTGFGLNSQMRAARELMDKTEQTLGGNRQQKFHYRLTIENFGEEPVEVQLYDRIPEPMGGADIRLTLGEMSEELSEDASYLEQERRRGILRWDLKVAGESAGPEALKVEYRYTLEFDRKLSVLTPAEAGKSGEIKKQFDQFQERRMRAY